MADCVASVSLAAAELAGTLPEVPLSEVPTPVLLILGFGLVVAVAVALVKNALKLAAVAAVAIVALYLFSDEPVRTARAGLGYAVWLVGEFFRIIGLA